MRTPYGPRSIHIGFILSLAALLLVACSEGTEEARLLRELQHNQQLWQDQGIDAYSFTSYHHNMPGPSYSLEVEVQQGEVASAVVRMLGSNEEVTDAYLIDRYGTVERMFSSIRDFVRSDVLRVEVTYDSHLGIPKVFGFTPKDARIADGAGGFTVAEFSVTPSGE